MTQNKPLFLRAPIRESALLLIGGLGYYGIEIAFRGRSHWSMAICGGVCLCAIYHMNRRLRHKPIFFRALCGALIITAVEFVCGCIVNLLLGWKIWDYSGMPYQLLGQICLPFSLLWAALCLPVCAVCSLLTPRQDAKKLPS